MVRFHPGAPNLHMKKTTRKLNPEEIKLPRVRLDVFVSEKQKISRSQAQKLVESGRVTVNGEMAEKTGLLIAKKDKVKINKESAKPVAVGEKEIVETEEKNHKPVGEIKIITETSDYLVIEKPNGMLTHSTMKNETDSLAFLLAKKYPELKKVGEDPMRPGIIHRLDKEASGLLIVPRTNEMFDYLKKQFKLRQIQKEYLVLVHEPMPRNYDEITFPIVRSKTEDRMSALPITTKGETNMEGKEAITEFFLEKQFVNFSLIRVKIHTGRMHQIRVHMLAYNHPVVGDPLYFQKKQKRTWDNKLGRLFLHCTKLSFVDLSGQTQTFESPLPPELSDFLKLLK